MMMTRIRTLLEKVLHPTERRLGRLLFSPEWKQSALSESTVVHTQRDIFDINYSTDVMRYTQP